jgi:hypothetical protein
MGVERPLITAPQPPRPATVRGRDVNEFRRTLGRSSSPPSSSFLRADWALSRCDGALEACEFIRLRERRPISITLDCWGDGSNGVSRMPVTLDHDQVTESRREHVLALRKLRRDLERLSTRYQADWSPLVAVSECEVARELEELIAAIDRRLPRLDWAGEAAIARDAAALRAKAVERLAELARHPTAAAINKVGPT